MKPKNIRFTILVIALAIGFTINWAFAAETTISDVQASNYTSSSVTISFITNVITSGATVYYGTTTSLGSEASDAQEDDTHYVAVTGLNPETLYYYKVVSGGVTDDNNGNYYTFTSAQTAPGGAQYIVYGHVFHDRGNAVRTIVYLRVTHVGVASHFLSALTDNDGNWSLNLSNLKSSEDGSVLNYSSGDPIYVFMQGANDGTASHNSTVSGNQPQDLGDKSLPVFLSDFSAVCLKDDKGVILKWTAETEINNMGWNVYRSEKQNGEFVKVNKNLIAGAGNSAFPREYEFLDGTATPGKKYYYYLEDIDVFGKRNKSNVIVVNNHLRIFKLGTTWGFMKKAMRK